MNNPILNEYVDKIKEYTDTYFIQYIHQLECKNKEYTDIIQQLKLDIECKSNNYVTLENDFIDLKKVSHIKNLDKQLCDALRDNEILKKKLEKYDKKTKVNNTIKSNDVVDTNDIIDKNIAKKNKQKNKKKNNYIEEEEDFSEDINEYVNEYINNNIIVKESDLDDLDLYLLQEAEKMPYNYIKNDTSLTILISDDDERDDKIVEKRDTKIIREDTKIIREDTKIIEENTQIIREDTKIIKEVEDTTVENDAAEDEMELIEKKIGKTIYYMCIDNNELYEKLDNDDVGNLIGHISIIEKNGKKREKIIYLNNE